VVLDAETVQARARDAYVGDTVVQQLQQADLFILNKLDLLSPGAQATTSQWLAQHHGNVPVALATQGEVPPALVLNLQTSPVQASELRHLRPMAPAQDLYEHRRLALPPQVDLEALVRSLTEPGATTLRAKGFVQGLDGQRWLLHTTGRRAEATLWPMARPWPGEHLLVIRIKPITALQG
jgi:G3E family GTPase